jgi:hypothetical protein
MKKCEFKKLLENNIEKFPISFQSLVFKENIINDSNNFKTSKSKYYNDEDYVIFNLYKPISRLF